MSAWIVTANRLRDGRVVWLSPRGWSESLREASVAEREDERRALEALAAQSVAACEVVDPYLVEVERTADGLPLPVRLRERIRALGPTVHPELWRDPDGEGGRRVPL